MTILSKEEIVERIKGRDYFTVLFESGEETFYTRNSENKWIRKIWGATAYLTDEELALELEEMFIDENITKDKVIIF